MDSDFLLDFTMAFWYMLGIEEMKRILQEEREKRAREAKSRLGIIYRGHHCYPGHKKFYRNPATEYRNKKKKKKKKKFGDDDLFCEVAEEMVKWSTKDGTLDTENKVKNITSPKYRADLFSDPSVKDTRYLHNHNKRVVLHMVVSDDNAYLLCAEADGDTSVWDLENEINVLTYSGHSSEVTRAAISRDNQVIVTVGNDKILNVWKLGMVYHPLCRFNIDCLATHLHISGDNKSVAVIGQRRNQQAAFMHYELKNATG